MSKHIHDFESYLSAHYGVEDFPLDYVVQTNLAQLPGHRLSLQNLRGNVHNSFPDFFQVDKTNFRSHHFAQIVLDQDNYHIQTNNPTMLAQWETGNKSKTWTDRFCCDDEIVFQLAHVAFKDSPGECHFVPKKGANQTNFFI